MGVLDLHWKRLGTWGVLVVATMVGARTEADQLRVMTLNVHLGMQQANELANTANIIRASGAHVVGIQEDQGAAQQLATALGWHYTTQTDADGDGIDIAILSQFPIASKSGNGVELALGYGRTAHVFNTHLHANPYQPYLIRDGSITNEAQAIASAEAARGAMIDSVLNQMTEEIAGGGPVFLLGDMNEPSHLDWTPAAASAGLHPFAVAYPASSSIEAAGLIDSYREAHPDPVTRPGYTWTNRPGANEIHDRIDFVHYAGEGVSVLTSRVVGERNAPAGGSVDIPFSGGNLPGDHRGVVTSFSLPYSIAAPYSYSIFNFQNGNFTPVAGSAGSMNYVDLTNNYTQQNTAFGVTGQGDFAAVPNLPDGPKQVMRFSDSGPAPYSDKGYRITHNRPESDGVDPDYIDTYTVMFDILIESQPSSGYIGLFNTNFANRNVADVLLDFTANDGTAGFLREGAGTFATGSIELGTWHRIALVARNSEVLDIFVDGEKVADDVPWDSSDSLYTTNRPTSLGTADFSILGDSTGLHGAGYLSSLAVFDEALTDRTIEKLGGAKAAGIAVPDIVFKGDFNEDGVIDAADYVVWRNTLDSTTDLRADANNNTVVDMEDYLIWKSNFGRPLLPGVRLAAATSNVPEPATWGMLVVVAAPLFGGHQLFRRRHQDI